MMKDFELILVIAAAGLVLGGLQSHFLFSRSTFVKSFAEHLDDLRHHARVGCLILAIILLTIAMYDHRIELLSWSLQAFVLSWLAIVALNIRRAVSETEI
jgi:hypothetical protein